MVATCHNPRRAAKQAPRWREEVSLPGLPIVAVRASLAAWLAPRAGTLAIEVITHMDDEVGFPRSNGFAQLQEWPPGGHVAVLKLATGLTGVLLCAGPVFRCL